MPITVQLDWKPGVQFAGLLVAQERGWYQDAGLAVTIRANDFKRPSVDVVAEDNHTVGTSDARTLVAARQRGLPVRAVATMFQASPVVLISLKSRGLRTLADHEWKTIGIHRPSDVNMLAAVFGTRPGEVPCHIDTVGFDFKELLAGKVDAVPGYVMDEPLRLAQSGTEVHVLPLADNGWTDYAQVLFVNQVLLAENSAALERFLTVTFRGWRAAVADPEGTAQIVVRQDPAGLDEASLRKALRRMAPLLTHESPHLGTMQAATWRQIIAQTMIDDPGPRLTVHDLADFRYMPVLKKD